MRMRIVFAWELGAGMGHLSPHRDLLKALKDNGHEITVISRDVARAERAYAGLDFSVEQAPLFLERSDPFHNPTATMAQVLYNAGICDVEGVYFRACAWRRIIERLSPDLVLMDYAPTLQIALMGKDVPAAVFATGYFIPPASAPLPVFLSMRGRLPSHLPTGEEPTLSIINEVLARLGSSPLKSISDLWHRKYLGILKTYPELDHYPERATLAQEPPIYVGSPPSPLGDAPQYPTGNPRGLSKQLRVFAYLKPNQIIGDLLEALLASGQSCLVASDGIKESTMELFRGPTLHFQKSPINLYRAFESADLVITNGNHGTTAHALLAGIPVLAIPLHLEQHIIGLRVQEYGAGICLRPGDATQVAPALEELLSDQRYKERASQFALAQKSLDMSAHLTHVFSALQKIADVGPAPLHKLPEES